MSETDYEVALAEALASSNPVAALAIYCDAKVAEAQANPAPASDEPAEFVIHAPCVRYSHTIKREP